MVAKGAMQHMQIVCEPIEYKAVRLSGAQSRYTCERRAECSDEDEHEPGKPFGCRLLGLLAFVPAILPAKLLLFTQPAFEYLSALVARQPTKAYRRRQVAKAHGRQKAVLPTRIMATTIPNATDP